MCEHIVSGQVGKPGIRYFPDSTHKYGRVWKSETATEYRCFAVCELIRVKVKPPPEVPACCGRFVLGKYRGYFLGIKSPGTDLSSRIKSEKYSGDKSLGTDFTPGVKVHSIKVRYIE